MERKHIYVQTLKKVKKNLEGEEDYKYLSDIGKQVRLDIVSVRIALKYLNIERDEKGRVKLKNEKVKF